MVLLTSRHIVAIGLLCLLLLLGCQPTGEADAENSSTSVEHEAVADLPFATQLLRVQSSESTEIRVRERPLTQGEVKSLSTVHDSLQVLECYLKPNSEETPDADRFEEILPNFKHLRQLVIHSSVDDEMVEAISACSSLRVVNLPKSTVTRSGLASLTSLPNLELLRISSYQLTDEGLELLQGIPSLRFLHLIHCPITDVGLTHIAALKQLESFYLDGSQCTDAGLSHLVKTRPDLHFHWNDSHVNKDAHPHEH